MNVLINQYSKDLTNALESLIEKGPKDYRNYEFDCNFLSGTAESLIRNTKEHKAYEKVFRPLKGPVLYWFQITSSTNLNDIRAAINEYSKTNHKKVPALRRKVDENSDVLYLGKVKRYFWSRVIQHIGIYSNERTQGLQLKHWTEGLDLQLKLHAYEFERDMSNLVSLFEKRFAEELKPIIGKH